MDGDNAQARVEALVDALEPSELISLAAGSGLWYSTPVPRLSLPSFKMSDGPNGVRGESRVSGVTSTCFPVGTALGASWDVKLLQEIGVALAAEARAKGVDMLLGPTINLQRTPLAGRNFECYAEDPLLTAELAIAYTRGVQGEGVSVCLKHFVCNDSEFERHTISSDIDTRTLREVYLRPFERAIKEAGAWAVMAAYNRLNGVQCSGNRWLLTEVLRDEWGFDGVVISDWGGTHDTVAPALAGLDVEMPGPPRRMGERLARAIDDGAVDLDTLREKARRQFRLMDRTGRLDAPEHGPETSGDDPARRALAQRAAIAGMVLLKNDDALLPLSDVRRLAVIGPNAVDPQLQGGGSSGVTPHFVDAPADALAAALPGCDVQVARGARAHRYLPLLPMDACRAAPDSDRAGVSVTFHAGLDWADEPVAETRPRRSDLLFFGRFHDDVPDEFSAVLRSWFTPRHDGVHGFSLLTAGRAQLFVDGELVVDDAESWRAGESFFGNGGVEQRGERALRAGETVAIEVRYSRRHAPALAGLRVGLLEPEPFDLLTDAIDIAAEADAAIVIVGLNGEWETEGVDRADMQLPGPQLDLVRAVLKANPRTLVVLNAGSPIDLAAFRYDAPAILQLWYPGQAFGSALAEVLTGRAEPGGRLPHTIPERFEDHPAFLDYPGEFGHVRYGEGVFVGHRGFQARGVAPAFAFGHGLGYTRFTLDGGTAVLDGDEVVVEVTLRNSGGRDGATIVQIYQGAPGVDAKRPYRELCAFERVALAAGATGQVALRIPLARFAFHDPARAVDRTEGGETRIDVGFSSADIRVRMSVVLPEQVV